MNKDFTEDFDRVERFKKHATKGDRDSRSASKKTVHRTKRGFMFRVGGLQRGAWRIAKSRYYAYKEIDKYYDQCLNENLRTYQRLKAELMAKKLRKLKWHTLVDA